MGDRGDEGIEGLDHRITHDVVKSILRHPPPPLLGDVNFEETPTGYEVWYSDRIANEYQVLVDQSADWLENEMGVLNLGQIDHKVLLADGVLTEEVRDGLIGWWTSRIEDVNIG
jgi:hypothetical protein